MLESTFKSDCDNCQSICCAAPRLSTALNFGIDKDPGVICENFCNRVKCTIWEDRLKLGWQGCVDFECAGAGNFLTCVFNNLELKPSFHRQKPCLKNPSLWKRRCQCMDMVFLETYDLFYNIGEAEKLKNKTKESETIFERLKKITGTFKTELQSCLKISNGTICIELISCIGNLEKEVTAVLQDFYRL